MLRFSLLITTVLTSGSNAKNFLMIPHILTSHCLEIVRIADELINRHHTVAAYVPEFFRSSKCFDNSKVKVVTFKDNENINAQRNLHYTEIPEQVFNGKIIHLNLTVLSMMFQTGKHLCESALIETEKLKELKSQNIDMLLIDSTPGLDCMLYLSIYLNTQSAMVGTMIFPFYNGGPLQSHTLPFVRLSFSNPMGFPQRLINTLVVVFGGQMVLWISRYFYSVDTNKLKGSLPPEVLDADISYMSRHLALYIENTMDVLDYPRAVYPNFIRVGGLTTRPAQPLSKELDNFFSRAKKGVIVVSFGSMLRKAPPSFFEKMVRIFNNFEQSVLMSYHIDGVHGNVKTISWMPQNDVLAHNNTVLFVSHCGKNGLNEGFYHAVPIVCSPFYSDQFGNGQKVKDLNIGSTLSLVNSGDEEIISVIKEILNDKSIYNNIKRLSAIYQDDKFTPQQKAANALEHVLKFGGNHLRPVSSDFNFLSENMIDIWFVIFLFLFLCLYITFRIMKCCCRRLCKKLNMKTKKKIE